MKRGLLSALVLSAGLVFAAPAVALADGIEINGTQTGEGSVTVDEANSTITVRGNVTLDGTGNAFPSLRTPLSFSRRVRR